MNNANALYKIEKNNWRQKQQRPHVKQIVIRKQRTRKQIKTKTDKIKQT